MRFVRSLAITGLLALSACGGGSSTASERTVSSSQALSAETLPDIQTPETLPALVDASTDIDAIDMPVVLWFWSPG